MIVNLFEIPEDGRAYSLTRKTAELNKSLQDLIGDQDYVLEAYLRPLNSRDYEFTGTIKTLVPEDCSRCGISFNFPVKEAFKEILVPFEEKGRNNKSKSNQFAAPEVVESGYDYSEYKENGRFDIGEFIHEIVGLAVPFNVSPPETKEGDCTICELNVRGKLFVYDEELPETQPKSPFEALKNLKLN